MKVSADKKRKFCEALVRGGSPTTAAQVVGINRATAYRWKAADAGFAEGWADAREEKTEVIETVLYRKAVAGEPWAVCFYLRGHRPELFNRRQLIGIGGDPDAPPVAIESRGMIYPVEARHRLDVRQVLTDRTQPKPEAATLDATANDDEEAA